MYSLYHSLLAQHPRQLTPMRCARSTIAQLHRHFEDVVIENRLAALVVEALPQTVEGSAREISRLREVAKAAMDFFLFVSPEDPMARLVLTAGKGNNQPVVIRRNAAPTDERFVVIADGRFSAVLASIPNDEGSESGAGDHVIWTFEPDVVYSALEYLMARITAEHSFHASVFAKAVRVSMPKATSLQLTLAVTTKLARLLQEQSEREIAVNRIAAAIRDSMELESILQTAADEVGRTLTVRSCAVSLAGNVLGKQLTKYYSRSDILKDDSNLQPLLAQIETTIKGIEHSPRSIVADGDGATRGGFAHAAVPLVYEGTFVGILLVESDDALRVWEDNELLLLHTVADQLAVAVRQARLFAEMQQQALTDALTGCYNRRSFELQLERDLHLATRMRQPISLIMLDLDSFKNINDRAGHETGDLALRILADALRSELRAVDTLARFGGDEFAIILPQAAVEGVKIVAERLRQKVRETSIPGYGPITASFGAATFPTHASSRDTLVVAADRALYNSKSCGRNCVTMAVEDGLELVEEPNLRSRRNLPQESLSGH